MSKKRTLRNKSNPSFFGNSFDQLQLRHSQILRASTIKSKYIPNSKSTIAQMQTTNMAYFDKEKLFNRNICHFRDSFIRNDSSQLPFMCSLRKKTKLASVYPKDNKSTICQPFQAGQKSTSNTKTRKRITDLWGKCSKMSPAYYRWHNKSGMNIKQAMLFECNLRDYTKTQGSNPEQTKFTNLIKPFRYNDIQRKSYNRSQLLCPRLKKLFQIKQ